MRASVKADARQIVLEPGVGHVRGDDAAALQQSGFVALRCDHRHELVAVGDFRLFHRRSTRGLHHHPAQCRSANFFAHDRFAQGLRRRVQPQPSLMLKPSGATPMATTSAPNSRRIKECNVIGRAVGAIGGIFARPSSVSVFRARAFRGFDISPRRVVEPPWRG